MLIRRYIIFGCLVAMLLPGLVSSQELSIVSRDTDNVIGGADSGTNTIFAQQAHLSSVDDSGNVGFVTINAFTDAFDDNTLYDVYLRTTTPETTLLSAYHDFFNPGITAGHAEAISLSSDNTRGVILRQVTADGLHLSSTQRALYYWENGEDEVRLASAGNINFPRVSTDGTRLLFTGNGDILGDGFIDNAVYTATQVDSVWNLERVSVLTGGGNASGDNMNLYDTDVFLSTPHSRYGTPVMSTAAPHGLQVLFVSDATTLPDAHSGNSYVYIRKHDSDETTRISNRLATGASGDPGPCHSPAISGDGNLAAFATDDPFIAVDVLGDAVDHIYVLTRDGELATPHTPERALVDVSNDGTRGNGDADSPVFNHDGRFVVFRSAATNLANVVTNDKVQIYLRDRLVGRTYCLSALAGSGADADCYAPSISPSGRYVSFTSQASNLGAPGGVFQVYLYDRGDQYLNQPPIAEPMAVNADLGTDKTIVLDATDGDGDPLSYYVTSLPNSQLGELHDGNIAGPKITSASDESPYLLQSNVLTYHPVVGTAHDTAFTFKVREQGAEFTEFSDPATVTIHVADLSSGVLSVISDIFTGSTYSSSGQDTPSSPTGEVSVSATGQQIVFVSSGKLEPDDTDSVKDAYLFDRTRSIQKTFLASADSTSLNVNDVAISSSGGFVAVALLDALDSGSDLNSSSDVYLASYDDGLFSALQLVSVDDAGVARGSSHSPSVADSGERAVFVAPEPNTLINQIYMWNANDNSVTLVSKDGDGVAADAACSSPMISGNGNVIVFCSAAELTATTIGDGVTAVYAYCVLEDTLTLVSRPDAGAGAPLDGSGSSPSVSYYGKFIAFASRATNLVPMDGNGTARDVFLYNLSADSMTRITDTPTGIHSFYPRISADSRLIYFNTNGQRSGNDWSETPYAFGQAYLYDRETNSFQLLSQSGGAEGNGESYRGDVGLNASGDVRAAFASEASNLTSGDGTDRDVFVNELLISANTTPNSTSAAQITLDEDTNHTFQLSADDNNQNEVAFVILSAPTHGKLFDGLNNDAANEITAGALPYTIRSVTSSLTYEPSPDYNNSAETRDLFTFRARDLLSDNSPTETLTIAVNSINDDPTLTGVDDSGGLQWQEGVAASIEVFAADVDTQNEEANRDTLVVEIVNPLTGESIVESNGQYFYAYDPGFDVVDHAGGQTELQRQVTVRAQDDLLATAEFMFTITTEDVNRPPVVTGVFLAADGKAPTDDVFANDRLLAAFDPPTDADNDGVALTIKWFKDGSHDPSYDGNTNIAAGELSKDTSWYYTIQPVDDWGDANSQGAVTQSNTVAILNSPPVPMAQAVNVDEDQEVSITLSATDVDNDPLSFSIAQQPTSGTLTGTGSQITYRPDDDFFGDDSFTFQASDGSDAANALVTVDVNGTPDAPVLTLGADQLVIPIDDPTGQIDDNLLVLSDPDYPAGLAGNRFTVELLTVPTGGALTNIDSDTVSDIEPTTYDKLPLTFTRNDLDEFATSTVMFRVRDEDDELSNAVSLEVISGLASFTLVLTPGWNHVALPLTPLNGALDHLFEGEANLLAGNVLFWDADARTRVSTSALSQGTGYWMFALRSAAIVIAGDATPAPVPVYEGWNFVGPVGRGPNRAIPTALDGRVAPVWRYDQQRRRFDSVAEMSEGVGYWLKVNGTTTVDLTLESP